MKSFITDLLTNLFFSFKKTFSFKTVLLYFWAFLFFSVEDTIQYETFVRMTSQFFSVRPNAVASFKMIFFHHYFSFSYLSNLKGWKSLEVFNILCSFFCKSKADFCLEVHFLSAKLTMDICLGFCWYTTLFF